MFFVVFLKEMNVKEAINVGLTKLGFKEIQEIRRTQFLQII